MYLPVFALPWSAYLHVSDCICLYFMPDNLMICTRYIQICTPSRSAYLYVSACICLYFFPEYLRIYTEYMHQVRVISCADSAARRPRIISYRQHQSAAQPMPKQAWFTLTGGWSLHVRRAVTAAVQAQAKNRQVYLDLVDWTATAGGTLNSSAVVR